MTSGAVFSARDGKSLRFERAELWMLGVIVTVGLLAVVLTVILQRSVNWPPFLAGFFATLGLAGIGAYVRQTKQAPRIALALIGTGIFMGFTAVSALFIFSLFPLSRPLIDPTLIHVDAVMGYHWPSLVAWLADYPIFSKTLGYIYHTSLIQMMATILLLSVLAHEVTLHRFLLTGILTLILAVAVWTVIPSVGPSAFLDIPEADRLATGLYFSPAYGEFLLHLVNVGPGRISPEVITGVVAFPSYHMIMALLVFWYTRATFAFWPATILGLAMIPATLSHGGHHLIDLIAGFVVFVICAWLAGRLITAR